MAQDKFKVAPDLQHYMPGYEKTARYFKKNNLYKYLTENGDLQRAISYAEEQYIEKNSEQQEWLI